MESLTLNVSGMLLVRKATRSESVSLSVWFTHLRGQAHKTKMMLCLSNKTWRDWVRASALMANCHQSCAALWSPLLMGRPQLTRSISMSLICVRRRDFQAHGPNANKSNASHFYATQYIGQKIMLSIKEETELFIKRVENQFYKMT